MATIEKTSLKLRLENGVDKNNKKKVRSILRAGRTALCIRRAAARRAGDHFLQNYLSSGKAVMKEFMRKNPGNRRK